MSGKDENGDDAPYFGEYPADFFDFIMIDECHRGGAKDESSWRGVLEYFESAVQLGLTATPKRKDNTDTYKYFGEPVYSYTLKEGINDGFLTPFKVLPIVGTMDEYIYTKGDGAIIDGEPEEGRVYKEGDFNRIITIQLVRKSVCIIGWISSIRKRKLSFSALLRSTQGWCVTLSMSMPFLKVGQATLLIALELPQMTVKQEKLILRSSKIMKRQFPQF